MNEDLQARIARAKELLKTCKHAAMATVNKDGTPHNTPFYLMLDRKLQHVYFGSHPDSQHSRNVIRTGDMFIVLYDAHIAGGLYIKAINGRLLSGDELVTGLGVHNDTRARDGKGPINISHYQEGNPQRMFGADIMTLWVNVVERDASGHIAREYRHEITAADLL